MPLLGLLDLGQSPLAVLVDRPVYQLDDTDDPGLPEHGAPALMPQTCAVDNSNPSTHLSCVRTSYDHCYMIDKEAVVVRMQTDGDGRHCCPGL